MIQRIPAAQVNTYPPARGEDSRRNGSPPVPLRPDLKSGQETWLAYGGIPSVVVNTVNGFAALNRPTAAPVLRKFLRFIINSSGFKISKLNGLFRSQPYYYFEQIQFKVGNKTIQ